MKSGQNGINLPALKGVLSMSFDPYEFDRNYASHQADTLGQYTAKTFLWMVLGLLVCYAFGTAWFMVVYPSGGEAVGLWTALGWCVFPYVPFDLIKIGLALGLTSQLRRHVK